MKHNLHTHFYTIMLGISMLGIIACSSDNGNGDNTVINQDNKNSNEWVGDTTAMRLEIPALQKNKTGVYFLKYEAKKTDNSSQKCVNFCMEYDSTTCHSRWVAFTFDGDTKKNYSVGRSTWHADTKIPLTCRLSETAYSGSGYTRGHICASYDRQNSHEANDQTFLMSNMSPMQGDFNTNYWVTLEGLVQRWGRTGGFNTLYVCKGGTITSSQILGTWKTHSMSGASVGLPIPKYYFMAILAEFLGANSVKSYQAIGFLMEHKDYGYSGNSYPSRSVMKKHAMSIDDLEKITGIDFFCNLNDAAEDIVERSYSESAWTWN